MILLTLALAACAPEPADDRSAGPAPDVAPGAVQETQRSAALPDATPPDAVPLPPPALPVRSLVGQWAVTAGEARILLDIGPGRIDFDNCQQVAWRYTMVDGDLAIERTPAITIDIRPKPLPCAAPFEPGVDRMVEAIDGATRADPAAGGAIALSGAAGRIALEPLP